MKKLEILMGVILIALSTTSWAFFGLFSPYSDEEKVKDLSQATRWMIGNGPDIYTREGEAGLKERLKANISDKLRDNIEFDLRVNVIGDKSRISGGGVFGLIVDSHSDRFEGSAGVKYRTDVNGELYEFWNSRVSHQMKKYDIEDDRRYNTPAMSFFVVKVIKGSEKRQILHESDRFFDQFEVEPGYILKLPLDERALLETLQPENANRRRFFVGSPLENVRWKEVNGKNQYVKVDLEEEKLKERKRKLEYMEEVASYFPIEGIKTYKKSGKSGVQDVLKQSKVMPEFTFNEKVLKSGKGKVFTVEGDGVVYAIYLLHRTEVNGAIYEHWLLSGKEKEADKPLKRVSYLIAQVDSASELRELLTYREEPYNTYTTSIGMVIEFAPVDATLLE